VRIAIGSQVDVALRPLQGAEEFAQVLRLRLAADHGGDHETGVDDLAEAKLLGEVVRPGKQRRGRRLAVHQQLHPFEQHAVAERQIDALGRHVGFERLHGRVVAAGLVADRDRHAGEVSGPFHRRIGRTNTPAGATE